MKANVKNKWKANIKNKFKKTNKIEEKNLISTKSILSNIWKAL